MCVLLFTGCHKGTYVRLLPPPPALVGGGGGEDADDGDMRILGVGVVVMVAN